MKFNAYCSFEDKPYEGMLRAFLSSHSVQFNYQAPPTISSALLSADAILVTSTTVLKQITHKSSINHDDYIGSLWPKQNVKGVTVPILCLPPLKQIISTKPGSFIFRRFLSKILKPADWFTPSPFSWTLCNDLISLSGAFDRLANSHAIAVDIETSPAFRDWQTKTDPQHTIVCVAYTGITFGNDGNSFDCSTFVIPVSSMEHLKWIGKINTLPQPKIFQNGKYDNFYFLRFGVPVRNWMFDTMDMHHCMYAELPKNLGYISSFYLREVQFWKDEGKTGDLQDFYTYNAKDAWGTANAFLSQLAEAPPWAIQNYLIKFGLNFPCLACETDGIVVNPQELERVKKEQYGKQAVALSTIRKQIGSPLFNPSSPTQVTTLLKILGNPRAESSDAKSIEAAGDKHPIAKRILDGLVSYRKSSKLISTYLEAELWKGKLLYTLNPSGTDTGRLSSRESQLWCGTQLQNLPGYFKQVLYAEEGYYFGEGDNRQSESRCTAYISGDESLIAAVESEKDFHATNAAAFFGLPYDDILVADKEAKENPDHIGMTIRDLSKRTNHGASYNMGEKVLLATMGMKNVLRAKSLLKLPATFNPLQTCAFLLERFDATYPTIRTDTGFYGYIKTQIKLTKKLISALGWTRLCFGNPSSSKPDLNAYVAHAPQNLSGGILNEAFSDIYWKIQVKSAGAFRLKGQIHDSIPFTYKQGRLDLVEHAAHLMTRPKLIRDINGKTRTMTIPIDLKGEGVCWRKLKKLEWDGKCLRLPAETQKISSSSI